MSLQGMRSLEWFWQQHKEGSPWTYDLFGEHPELPHCLSRVGAVDSTMTTGNSGPLVQLKLILLMGCHLNFGNLFPVLGQSDKEPPIQYVPAASTRRSRPLQTSQQGVTEELEFFSLLPWTEAQDCL